jgi:cytochrome c oxidase subunit 2
MLASFKAGDQYLQMAVEARQWEYRFRYPSLKRFASWSDNEAALRDFQQRMPESFDDVHVVNNVHTWKDQKVMMYLKTRDVSHAMFFPQLRLKQDALPGKTIPVWFQATVANTKRDGDKWSVGYANGQGEYNRDYDFDLVCTQYCGSRHSLMRGKLFVHPTKEDFLAWLAVAEKNGNSRTEAVVGQ